MPDDLLQYVTGPEALGWTWLWLPAVLLLLLIGWYAAVFVLTATGDGVVARTRDALSRRRYLGEVRRIRGRLADGALEPVAAGAELNRTLRAFLQHATGEPVEYMHVAAMTEGEIAGTATLFARFDDARFNDLTREDVAELGAAAEEVISSWA